MQLTHKKHLSVFGLTMMNVVAIDSLRTLPMSAEYGFSLVFYHFLAAIFFFIPTALVAAELATGWPETGGIYIWVREAFGKKIGFITIWLQWFYNVCWYPTIMSFIAATLAYCVDPNLVNNKFYMLSVIILLFWACTLIHFWGMRASSLMSTLSAIIGTLLPMIFIIILGIIWLSTHHPAATEISWHALIPEIHNMNSLVLFTGIVYGYAGIEMSAIHAREVHHPQRDYPRAAVASGLIIFLTLVLASLAIAIVIPPSELNIISGLLQAFDVFFAKFHLAWFTPMLALLITFGSLGGVNAWILGPSKSLMIASRDGCLPAYFGKQNSHHVPITILIFQGILFTLLCSVFLFFPTISSGFWVLSDVTAILALIAYVAMFAAAIQLRYKFPNVKRAFRIPGRKIGLWLVCLLGLISSLVTIFIGFFPPSQIPTGNIFIYESILIGGVILGCLLPLGLYRWARKKN